MSSKMEDPFLPLGSLILVTAANGFIASHIVDQLLEYGYAVRGTVRSYGRSSWLIPLFQTRHPNSQVEMVEVPDITAPGCYDAVLKGVSAVIHTAANTTVSDDTNIIAETVEGNLAALRAVANANKTGGNIPRVVLTSSSWAASYAKPNTPQDITVDTYEEMGSQALADPSLAPEARGLMVYLTSKAKFEQESWKWWRAHSDTGFSLNTILPATTLGPVLSRTEQPYASTAGWVRRLFEGKNAHLFGFLEPQWYVDVGDVARLHVAAAVLNKVEGERIFAYAEPYTWPGIANVLENEMGTQVPIKLEDKGVDLTRPPRERSTELLKKLGRETWVPFEQSVRDSIRSFYPGE